MIICNMLNSCPLLLIKILDNLDTLDFWRYQFPPVALLLYLAKQNQTSAHLRSQCGHCWHESNTNNSKPCQLGGSHNHNNMQTVTTGPKAHSISKQLYQFSMPFCQHSKLLQESQKSLKMPIHQPKPRHYCHHHLRTLP